MLCHAQELHLITTMLWVALILNDLDEYVKCRFIESQYNPDERIRTYTPEALTVLLFMYDSD